MFPSLACCIRCECVYIGVEFKLLCVCKIEINFILSCRAFALLCRTLFSFEWASTLLAVSCRSISFPLNVSNYTGVLVEFPSRSGPVTGRGTREIEREEKKRQHQHRKWLNNRRTADRWEGEAHQVKKWQKWKEKTAKEEREMKKYNSNTFNEEASESRLEGDWHKESLILIHL